MDDAPKAFNRIRKIREKPLSLHKDYCDFRGVLYIQSRPRICQKYFSLHEEHA
jgi:hypothetical protein